MRHPLQWQIERSDAIAQVRLSGSLDEDSDFDTLLGECAALGGLLIDASGIARINSCGVREWLRFTDALPQGVALEFERCSPAIVRQLNLIHNFTRGGRVRSIFAPYICFECEQQDQVLITLETGQQPDLPRPMCSSCDVEMELDDDKENFFSFHR